MKKYKLIFPKFMGIRPRWFENKNNAIKKMFDLVDEKCMELYPNDEYTVTPHFKSNNSIELVLRKIDSGIKTSVGTLYVNSNFKRV